jgi:fatty acid desaturase
MEEHREDNAMAISELDEARRRRKDVYALRNDAVEQISLQSDALEDRVEKRWFTCDLPRKTLKELTRRSDAAGLKNFGIWLALLAASGYAGFLAWGTWWAVPAFFVYGTLYSSSDARWHECGHGTCFRTRWLNDFFYHISSFMTLREAYLWRWSHSRHHTYTNWVGLDEEIQVMRPATLMPVFLDFLFLYGGPMELKRIFLHAFGVVTPNAKILVPAGEIPKMMWSSRAYVAVMAGVVGGSIAIGSFLPMMFVVLPRFYGGWLHQIFSLTQHAGLAENKWDHRCNARTVYLNPVYRFLYLNMNYHIEHHIFPMVPFYALPRLHEAVKDRLPRPYAGVIDAYREIIPAIIKQASDPNYYVRRLLPEQG